MRTRLLSFWSILRSSYWFIPSLLAAGSIFLSYAAVKLDEHLRSAIEYGLGWEYAGGAEGARAVLSTIAGSIITVAGTTFSITIAALSLASSQFGPRLLRTFRRDTGNQVVLGVFISTFLYCLMVLRTVRGTDQDTFVPHLSVTFGVVLAVLSLGVLIYFIHHMAASIQVSNVIAAVAVDLEASIQDNLQEPGADVVEPERGPAEPEDGGAPRYAAVRALTSDYILRIDYAQLQGVAAKLDNVMSVLFRPGDFVMQGMPLVSFRQPLPGGSDPAKQVRSAFVLANERSPEMDPEFGFLQLAEIAVRALSSGVNDPFTAMACLDRLAASLSLAAQRTIPGACHYDAEGKLRLVCQVFTYQHLVEGAFAHIRRAAEGNEAVQQHLRQVIKVLLDSSQNVDFRNALSTQYLLTPAPKGG